MVRSTRARVRRHLRHLRASRGKPRFAICDYLQNGVVDEFHLFAKRFTEAGHPCTVCDVRDLTFDGEVLRDKEGQPVHAIWRRCVTNDVLEFWDEQALIGRHAKKWRSSAASPATSCTISRFSRRCSTRMTQAFLTPEEIAFVERTVLQTRYTNRPDAIRADKDAWIIKPTDAYGARPTSRAASNAGAMGADHREVRQRGRRRAVLVQRYHAV